MSAAPAAGPPASPVPVPAAPEPEGGRGASVPSVARPRSRRSTTALVGVAVAVVVAILVLSLYLGAVGPFSRAPNGPPAASGDPTFEQAEATAEQTAAAYHSGAWNVVLAAAVASDHAFNESTNVSSELSEISTANCTLSPVAPSSSLAVAADTGNLTDGRFPAWAMVLTNGSSGGLVVGVLGPVGVVVAAVTDCSADLGSLEAIPSSTVDSPAALSAALNDGGYAFLRAHPGGNVSLVGFGGLGVLGVSIGGEWLVTYSTCPATGLTHGNVTSYTFEATVGLATGSVLKTPTQGSESCRVSNETAGLSGLSI